MAKGNGSKLTMIVSLLATAKAAAIAKSGRRTTHHNNFTALFPRQVSFVLLSQNLPTKPLG
jgi:hypothetical protein